MNDKVSDRLCLDSTGTDGLAQETSKVVSMDGLNTIQALVIVYALTATALSVQVQVSNNGANWQNQGSAQTVTAFGRKVLTAQSSIGAAHTRLLYTLDGSGKAILDAHVAVSRQ